MKSQRVWTLLMVLCAILLWGGVFFFPPHNSSASSSRTMIKAVGTPLSPPLSLVGDFGGWWADYTAVGNYVYAVQGQSLRVISFENPAAPTVVGELFSDVILSDIEVNGDGTRLLAVSAVSHVVLLFNITTPETPRELFRTLAPPDTLISAYSFQVIDNRAYLTFRTPTQRGFVLYGWENDVVVLRGMVNDGRYGEDVLRQGNTLIVATLGVFASEIYVYNISNEAAPQYVSTIPSRNGFAFTMNDYLYVANEVETSYVDIWDIKDPTRVQLAHVIPDIRIKPLAWRGTSLIAYEGPPNGQQLTLYDVSDPFVLQSVGTSETYVRNMVWTGDNMFYKDNSTLEAGQVIQQAIFTVPFTVTTSSPYTSHAYNETLFLNEQYIYLKGDFAGADLYDMRVPGQPHYISTVLETDLSAELTLTPNKSVVDGNTLYVVREEDIAAFDITDPNHPYLKARTLLDISQLNTYYLYGNANGYLYGLSYGPSATFFIVRQSDLAVTMIPFDKSPVCFSGAVKDRWLGLHCEGEIFLYDIHDPIHPTLIGLLSRQVGNIYLQPPYLMIRDDHVLQFYDFTNPATPKLISGIPLPTGQNNCPSLHPIGDEQYLWLCSSNGGYGQIVDARLPYHLRVTDIFQMHNSYSAATDGNLLIYPQANDSYAPPFEIWQINRPFEYPPYIFDRAVYLPLMAKR